jgi:phosphatidylserine decarboxylase
MMAVCVGAMMVGSIQTTVQEGDHVQRGQEFGYFAFGNEISISLQNISDTLLQVDPPSCCFLKRAS